MPTYDRREFMIRSAGAAAGAAAITARADDAAGTRPRVAAIFTEFRSRSHAHVILENFLEPYLFNGKRVTPDARVVSFFADQSPAGDMARDVAKAYGIEMYPSIEQALCAGGTELAVDAVLSIGEHGRYPTNAKGQREYPRKRFFDETVAVLRRTGRVVPIFNDKHLSYRWDWAKEMYDTARDLKIPLMAGSSVPLAERIPPLELPAEARIAEAVSIHGGPFESYDFHALEVMQSLLESRSGGETGVSRVRLIPATELWKAADEGLWSPRLADAAMAAELGPGQPALRELVERPPFDQPPPHGILVEYRDETRGIALKIGRQSTRWNLACRLVGEEQPRATRFYVGPWNNRNLFKALGHAIQVHFRERKAPYPVERTLLVTGILEASADSRARGAPIETPHLDVRYAAADFRAMREMGASWKIITEETPEPQGIQRS